MSASERGEIARRLAELEADAEALKAADQMAGEGFRILDQTEATDSAKTE